MQKKEDLKILLIGGEGYIGSAFSDLAVQKKTKLANVGRKCSTKECFEVSSSSNSVDIQKCIEQFKPSVIINFSANYSKDVDEIIDTNIKMPVRILEYISSLINPPIFLQISTYWQLGDEVRPNIPIDLYSSSKKAFLSFLNYYGGYKKIPVCNLVLYGTYGDKDNRGKLLDQLIQSIELEEKLKVSPGFQKLNLVHVNDVCSAIWNLISEWNIGYSGRQYSIYDTTEYTPRDLVSMIEKLAGKKAHVSFGSLPYREVELMTPRYEAHLPPGWKKNHSLIDYIKDSLKNIRSTG